MQLHNFKYPMGLNTKYDLVIFVIGILCDLLN